MAHNETPPEPEKRRKRFRRDEAAKKFSLRLQPRDLQILKALAEARLLSTDQIVALVPPEQPRTQPGRDYDPAENVVKRLRRLYDHRLLDRVAHQGDHLFDPELGTYGGSRPIVHALGSQGAAVLKLSYPERKNRDLSSFTTDHQLEASNFYVTLRVAARHGLHRGLAFWRQGRQLADAFYADQDGSLVDAPSSEQRRDLARHVINPDAFCCLRVPNPANPSQNLGRYYFVESDRSSMSGRQMRAKFEAYYWWFRNRRHTAKWGLKFFIVLTLTISPERRDTLRKLVAKLERADAPTPLFWFATQRDFTYREPQKLFSPIWYTAHSAEPRRLLT